MPLTPLSQIAAPPETHSERRRRLISLDIERIALRAFAERGDENVKIEDIARASGLASRTFYRYITSKERLLYALPRRIQAKMAAEFAKRPTDETIIESYRYIIAHKLELSQEDEEVCREWYGIIANSRELPGWIPRDSKSSAIVVNIARRLGVDMDADPRPRVLAGALGGAIDAALEAWLANGGTGDRAGLMTEALDILAAIDSIGRSEEDRSSMGRS